MMRNAEKIANANAERAAAGRIIRESLSKQLAAAVRRGMSVKAAGIYLGWGMSKTKDIAKEFGIKASAATLHAARSRAGKANIAKAHEARANKPKAAPITSAPRAAPNPYRTAAQQQNIEDTKRRMWGATHGTPLRCLPPVTDDEAARLISEHIARKGVTVCPAAASPEKPFNAGVWFR